MKKIYKETKIIIISLPEYISDERVESLRSREIHNLENVIQVEKIDGRYLVFEYLDSASGNTLDTLTKMGDVSQIYEITSNSQKQKKLLELYKELSNYIDYITYSHKLTEIFKLKQQIKELEKLLERDTPMKPTNDNGHSFTQYSCGSCGCTLDITILEERNSCPECGHKLWSIENE